MARSLTQPKSAQLIPFAPGEARDRELQIEAAADLAKKLKDWETLDVAVDAMIEHQTAVVAWWGEKVTPGHGKHGKNADRGTFPVADAEKLLGLAQQKISKWSQRLEDIEAYSEFLRGPSYRTAMGESLGTVRGTGGTEFEEWYTPAKYLDMAREALGEIDLDPATSEHAQQTVRAAQWFTADDDGLSHDWYGNVWLNPPYTQPLIAQFMAKLVEEVERGNVIAAIALTHNYTDTEWFQNAARAADAICFTRGRVKFVDETGKEAAPTQGQAFFYFGSGNTFQAVFADIGFVR